METTGSDDAIQRWTAKCSYDFGFELAERGNDAPGGGQKAQPHRKRD
jgi:hypothetical protein